jgi:hypothetical protein
MFTRERLFLVTTYRRCCGWRLDAPAATVPPLHPAPLRRRLAAARLTAARLASSAAPQGRGPLRLER